VRILFINQFIPPDEAPTSRLMGELAEGLVALGWEADFLGGSHQYRAKALRGWRRWLRDVKTHARVLLNGVLIRKPDIVFCLTDPPALVFTASIVAGLRGARLVHWGMDIYPQIASALGELKADSPIYKVVKAAADFGYQRCDVIGCLDADMARALSLQGDERVYECPPWPPSQMVLPETAPHREEDRVRILYSGNLGRAHDYETLLRAQKILENQDAPFELVFQGGGPNRQPAMHLAEELGLKRCQWLDYAADDEFISSLLGSHILTATQRIETSGLLWPSKLAVMRHLHRPILWIGPLDGAIASLLQKQSEKCGIFAQGDDQGVASWLLANEKYFKLSSSNSYSKEQLLAAIKSIRQEAINSWSARLLPLLG